MLDSRWSWMWILSALLCVAFIFTALPANGAPKPNYAARLTADFHLQVEVTAVQLPDAYPGYCLVSGTIVRLFRARANTLDTGDRLDLPVLCTVSDDETPMDDMTGVAELEDARFIEMYVNPRLEDGFALADQQFMVIKNPSDAPQCETDRAGIMC